MFEPMMEPLSGTQPAPQTYGPRTYTLRLTADELRIARGALRSYLSDFGHDEVEVLHTVKRVIAKLGALEAAAETDAAARAGEDPA
jgi:hypothetical protein